MSNTQKTEWRRHENLSKNHLDKAKETQKKYYDQKIRAAKLETGDRVLVKIVAFEGKHKIQDKFGEEPYVVVEQPNKYIPVCKVRSDKSDVVKSFISNRR